jgi:hypothetical protein
LRIIRLLSIVFIGLTVTACATYYQQNEAFNQYFRQGDIANATKALDETKTNTRNKNRSLYLLNKGTLSWMQENYTEATNFFNEADLYIEDQRKNFASEALALISNPGVRPYVPEDFENVMVNIYKALSYLELNNTDKAIVECRRVNEKLYALNDKYPKNYKNRYSDDAFAHTIMGLIYDSKKDWNNAFIAYRNAYKIYEDNYLKNYNTPTPLQLKKDLLRTAYLTGLNSEYDYYKRKFGFDFDSQDKTKGSLVFIWMSGLGPVKEEWSINFSAITNNDGMLTLANGEEGINFPFYIGDRDRETKASFKNLDFVRVAFPKYHERQLIYNNAVLEVNNSTSIALSKGQDINAIAFKCLKDRMLRELANSLLRLASKQALEKIARDQNDNLGTLVSIFNAVTEKADTRNWQTLPHSIYYTRVQLDEGENKINLISKTPNGQEKVQEFTFNIQKGRTKFFTFHDLEAGF